jgi:hypothetical protein
VSGREVVSRRTRAEAVFADCMDCGRRVDVGGGREREGSGVAKDVRGAARRHAATTGHTVYVTVEHSLIYSARTTKETPT